MFSVFSGNVLFKAQAGAGVGDAAAVYAERGFAPKKDLTLN